MAVAAIGLFFISYQWGNHFQRVNEAPLRLDGILLRPAVALPDIVLRGPQGELSAEQLRERWTLIAFGSPGSAAGHRGVARLIEVWNRCADRPELRDELLLLLVSADDAPALARDFERLTPSLRVVSTSITDLTTLREAFGAGDVEGDGPPPLYLLGPRAHFVALFTGTQPAQSVATDLKSMADRPNALPELAVSTGE